MYCKGKPISKSYNPTEEEVQRAKELYCAARLISINEINDKDDGIFYFTIKHCKEGRI